MSLRTVTRLRSQAAIAFTLGGGLGVLAVASLALIFWDIVTALLSEGFGSLDLFVIFLLVIVSQIVLLLPALTSLTHGRQLLARVAAIHSRPTNLLESRIQTHAEKAPDVSIPALMLYVASGRRSWRVVAYLLVVYPLILVGLVGALIVRYLTNTSGAGWTQALAGALAGAIFIFGPPWREQFVLNVGRTISADLHGLSWKTLLGGTHTTSWDEWRLLEVSHYGIKQNSSAGYKRILFTLNGERTILRWLDTLDGRAASHTQALLDLIAARANLLPRTFDSSLGPSRFDELPQTVNVGRRVLTVTAERAHESVFVPSHRSSRIIWRENSPRTRRFFLVLGFLLILFDGFEVARILGGLGVVAFQAVASGIGTLDLAIGTLFLFALLFGPLLFIAALRREMPNVVTATDTVLIITRARKTTEVAWTQLQELQGWEMSRNRGAFRAVDVSGSVEIGWPLHPRPWPGPTPSDAGTMVTSEELAQIVATRIEAAQHGNTVAD